MTELHRKSKPINYLIKIQNTAPRKITKKGKKICQTKFNFFSTVKIYSMFKIIHDIN